MIKFFIFFLTLFLSGFTLMSNDILTISEVSLVILSGIILLDFFDKRSLSLFQVWLVGFIFIILSEAILIESTSNILKAVKYLLLANNLIIFGYLIPQKFKINNKNSFFIKRVKSSKWTSLLLILLVISYLIYALPGAILTYNLGRNTAASILFEERNLFLSSFFDALAFVLPSVIVFFYKEIKKKKSLFIPLFISIPIFVILFVGGSRFPLLFSFSGFMIISQIKPSGKITVNLKMIIFILLLVTSSFLMGQFRSGGLGNFQSTNQETMSDTRLSKRIANEMSPEGVVDMTALSMTYFESNSHTYGKSISFITYFWIPRAIWPDKPTMIGHWLIRKYRSGFSEGHSASFGFTGELFADFGYFSLFFVFLLGILLKWADLFSAYQLTQPISFSKIIVGMIYPYVFFFVRSPITASTMFLGILVVFVLIRKLLYRKINYNTI